MKGKKLLRYLVANRDTIHDKIPSAGEMRIINILREYGPLTSIEIADHLSICPVSASTRLCNSMNRGYLKRIDIGAPSGGSLYKYSYAL